MKLIKLLTILFSISLYAQQGGMWIPSLLEGMNENEMISLGMKITASDIYNTNKSSLKDAVPHFNNGCTSEVISPKGLLLTNHHCGYGQIQSHSSITNDYLTDGFWAKNTFEELPNPGLSVTFIIRIEDVTQKVLKNTQNINNELDKNKKIQENITRLERDLPKETWQENRIRTFYHGNQYILFVVEVFKDVRLVGTPPSSIGKFGSDTDNWVWPRHTGDFALFRIYADKNNRPTEYNPENVPYTPKHYLPISLDGISENDFTMVIGFPGRTQEYLPAVAVEQIVNILNPIKIQIRDVALKIQDTYMRQDQEIKIKYASKYARIANYWKKWIGENQGLKKTNAIAAKKEQERKFEKKIYELGKENQYGHLLTEFDKKYSEIEPYSLANDIFTEIVYRNVDLLANALRILQLEDLYNQNEIQKFELQRENLIQTLEKVYKNYENQVDKHVFEELMLLYVEHMPSEFLPELLSKQSPKNLSQYIYSQSALVSQEKVLALIDDGTPQELIQRFQDDPAIQLVREMRSELINKVLEPYNRLTAEISALQRTYMKAILELSKPEDRIFPDANSTLRVTYGKVAGYSPADAIYYSPITYLDGVIEKYQPNDYEFDVPPKLIQLYNTKDYGIYGENGKMPVNFIATNHTTGGNSGSPALDAYGNLIGLNFDRVWEGTMSDIYYDPSICRNIMVDIRYVLFVIDKFAQAKHLIDEMTFVHPKKETPRKQKKRRER